MTDGDAGGENGTYRHDLDFRLREGEMHFLNVMQRYITTTEDRLGLIVVQFVEATRARLDIAAPASVFVTLVLTLVTADFKAYIWFLIFYGLTVIVGFWLALKLWHWYRTPPMKLEDVLRRCRGDVPRAGTTITRARFPDNPDA